MLEGSSNVKTEKQFVQHCGIDHRQHFSNTFLIMYFQNCSLTSFCRILTLITSKLSLINFIKTI